MEDAEVGEKELPLQSGVFDALLLLVAERNTVPGALRTFFQPIKTDDPRLDFYTMYKREASEYDTDYVKKYYEDLNTTLIFAGLFSAVSSAFVIDVNSNLQPDPYRSTRSGRSPERHRHRHLSHVCESSDLAARRIRCNVDPPYDLVVTTFEACFDSAGELYLGSRDRAHYTGRAMLWIHALAMCKFEEFADRFPLQLQNTKAQPVTLTLNVFYGSTWLGLLNPASYGHLMSDQDTPPHTPNG